MYLHCTEALVSVQCKNSTKTDPYLYIIFPVKSTISNMCVHNDSLVWFIVIHTYIGIKFAKELPNIYLLNNIVVSNNCGM